MLFTCRALLVCYKVKITVQRRKLHIDLAFPIDATADIKKVQFLVKTRTSF